MNNQTKQGMFVGNSGLARQGQPRVVFLFLLSFLLNYSLILFFHDRFWVPQDEGVFAHIAERLYHGDVLHRDIKEPHPGLGNYINAWAFDYFGVDLVVLRYPLIIAVVLQAAFIFWFFARSNPWLALLASLVPACLGVLHFLNPHPQWYVLLIVYFSLWFLSRQQKVTLNTFLIVGFLCGLLFLLRQLSGIFIGMGMLLYLLTALPVSSERQRFSFYRVTLIIFLFILAAYFCRTWEVGGFLLIGIWPMLILGYYLRFFDVANQDFTKGLSYFLLGVGAPICSMSFYFWSQGALRDFLYDSLVMSLGHWGQPFLRAYLFTDLIRDGGRQLLMSFSVPGILNGLYWVTLPLSAAGHGILFLSRLNQGNVSTRSRLLSLLAGFSALVSLHNQIPIYLYFSVALNVLAVLNLVWEYPGKVFRWLAVSSVLLWCGVAVYYHAAQPTIRGWSGYIRGVRVPLTEATDIPRVDLRIDTSTRDLYEQLLRGINDYSVVSDTIFTFPNNSELYFLSGRKNAFNFFSFDLTVTSFKELEHIKEQLKLIKPKLIIFSFLDKRNTMFSLMLGDYLREHYRFLERIDHFDFFTTTY